MILVGNIINPAIIAMIQTSNFTPKLIVRNPHWQSMWPTFIMRSKPELNVNRQRIELEDGDFIDLDWCSENHEDPIIILLHGVTGNISSPYLKYLVPVLVQHHWCPVVMYYRGYSGHHNRLDIMSHAGKTDDFTFIVQSLQAQYPKRNIAALGFSQGANMLLKYLGEQGTQTPLCCAVAVSPPFQLRSISNRIRHGISRFYQWYLLRELKAFYLKKFQYRPSNIDIEKLTQCDSFWQFDDIVTAPMNGFRSAVDYYAQASCAKYLPKITIPTLIIHAKDDTIMTPDIIPNEKGISSSTTLELSEHGGHLGFVSGSLFKPRFWLNERIPEFMQEYL